jgi:hypothetical protein
MNTSSVTVAQMATSRREKVVHCVWEVTLGCKNRTLSAEDEVIRIATREKVPGVEFGCALRDVLRVHSEYLKVAVGDLYTAQIKLLQPTRDPRNISEQTNG